MYKVFKFLVIIIVFVILNYLISLVYALTLFIIIAIFHYDRDLDEFSAKKVSKTILKVICDNCPKITSENYKKGLSKESRMNNSHFNNATCSYTTNQKSNGNVKNMETRITSTPLSSMSMRQKKSHASTPIYSKIRPMFSPSRYSLSESSIGNSTPNHAQSKVRLQPGPLLASTRYNTNLGTYTDCKSPGLTGRIVQYNNESNEDRRPLTHHAKYNSSGLFPIVHFFKPEVPVISPKTKRVTVKIANPDTSYTTYEQNRILSETMTQELNNSKRQDCNDTDISTRSVLDALKEISRKRIHATTDYELDQDGINKRQRTELSNGSVDYSKRNREDSPPSQYVENNKQKVKRVCLIDPVMASFSSSRLYQHYIEKGLKRKMAEDQKDVDVTEKEPKKRMSCNVETQTQSELQKEMSIPKENVIKKPVEKKNVTTENPKPTTKNTNITAEKDMPETAEENVIYENADNLVIFDNEQLEIDRKNKLAILLSAITGETPVLIPNKKYDLFTMGNDAKESNEPQIVDKPKSILSPHNKPRHEKHVSFNLPTPDPAVVSQSSLIGDNYTTITETIVGVSENCTPKQTSFSGFQTITTETTLTTSLPSPISFGSTLSTLSNNPLTMSSPTNGQINNLPFANNTSSPSNQKQGGFKFDFSSPPSTEVKSTGFGISSGNNTQIQSVGPNTTPITSTAETNAKTSPIFGNFSTSNNSPAPALFGAKTPISTSNVQSSFTFGDKLTPNNSSLTIPSPTTTNKSLFNTISTPQVQAFATSNSVPTTTKSSTLGQTIETMFGKASSATISASNANPNFVTSFGNNITENSNKSGFGNPSISSGFGSSPAKPGIFGSVATTVPSFGAIATTIPSFGAVATTVASFGAVATTVASFGAVTTTKSPFGAGATTPSGFGSTSTTATGFGAITTTTSGFVVNTPNASIFGSNTSFGSGTTSLPFGSTTTSSVFGGNVTSPAFGEQSAGKSAFGTPSTTAAYNLSTTTAGFGLPSTTVPFGTGMSSTTSFGNPTFGTPSTTTAVFGSSNISTGFGSNNTNASQQSTPAFGKPTTSTAVFGFGTNTSTSPSAFGSTASTGFGSVFGATTTTATSFSNNFNTVSSPGFGNSTTTSTFGTSFGAVTTTAASGFGQSTGSTFTFGSKTANNGFGATVNTNSTFGTPNTTTTTSFGFGTPTTQPPPFGSNNSFVGNNQSSFGNVANTTTSTNSFGTINTPTFGSGGSGFTSPNFGTTGFGAGNNSNNTFSAGAVTTPFGGGNNQTSFGSTDASFAKQPANTFNSNFSTNNFGNANSFAPQTTQANNSFDFNNAPSNSGGVFTFGANPPPPNQSSNNVFAFGSADKPKPAGFNFPTNTNATPFGATQNPSGFGATPTPAFGNNSSFSATSPQFNTPGGGGMFNIGSGTTTPRPRQQLKAKRRTQI